MLCESSRLERTFKNQLEKENPNILLGFSSYFVFRILDTTPCHISRPDAETILIVLVFRKLPVS